MDHSEIVKTLCKHGFETYIVGGAVRDFLNGSEPKDFDIVTKARPEEIMNLFPGSMSNSVGKSFQVTLIGDVEVATYRKDKHPEMFNAKTCVTEYADTLQEDLDRRDLTINAMALCHFTGDIIDIHGGKEDLNKSIIKFVGDPIERIKQDPNRIIRACRFLAKLEGTFDQETFKALQSCAHYVNDYVDPERIRIEILKAMEVDTPSLFFSALHLIGALKYILPEMDECFNHQHGFFHKETIGEHILAAGDNVSKKLPLVRLAAFLHDIGKPYAFRQNNDGSFIHHEFHGANIVKFRLKKLKFSNIEIETIANLVYCHMMQCRSLTPRGQRRLRKRLADLNVDPRSYIRVKLADRQANMAKDVNTFTPIKELVLGVGIRSKEEIFPLTTKDLILSGGTLINTFNLSPGPIVGKLQKHLLEFIVDNGNEFNTEEALLEQSRLFLEQNK